MVMRDDPSVETSDQVYFTSQRLAVRVSARVAYGFPPHVPSEGSGKVIQAVGHPSRLYGESALR